MKTKQQIAKASANQRYKLRHPERVKEIAKRSYEKRKAVRNPKKALLNKERRQWLHDYKLKRGCTDCGYRQHAEALDFDHRDPATKAGNVASMVHQSWQRMTAEMAKCDVVCANCHRVRTANRREVR